METNYIILECVGDTLEENIREILDFFGRLNGNYWPNISISLVDLFHNIVQNTIYQTRNQSNEQDLVKGPIWAPFC